MIQCFHRRKMYIYLWRLLKWPYECIKSHISLVLISPSPISWAKLSLSHLEKTHTNLLKVSEVY